MSTTSHVCRVKADRRGATEDHRHRSGDKLTVDVENRRDDEYYRSTARHCCIRYFAAGFIYPATVKKSMEIILLLRKILSSS